MNVAVIGVGYVGLTTALSLAYIGHDVIGIDSDSEKIRILSEARSPIHEIGLETFLSELKNSIRFTTNMKDSVGNSEIIIISVGTPPKPNGDADIKHVESVAREIACSLLEGRKYVIVTKSTVPIGTYRRLTHMVKRTLTERNLSASVYIGSNPEFLREGMALRDTLYPDRIIVGAEQQEAVDVIRRLYRPILEQTFSSPSFLPRPEGFALPPLITTDPTSAEMIKYAANSYLALKISFINEFAGLCERVGADVTEVARGIGMDPRIGPRFLQAGLGWGGSCFPKDTSAILALASYYGYNMPVVEAARQVNNRQRQGVIEKLQMALKVLRGRTIAILGIAFKPETDDLRDAPSLDIINALLELGAHVRVHDPVALDNAREVFQGLEIDFVKDPYDVADACDAVVLVTEWKVYQQIDLTKLAARMRNPVLVDGRNIYNPLNAKSAGFLYLGIGR